MSLRLTLGTYPRDLEIKTIDSRIVYLGDYRISMADFLSAVDYVLTNADLEPNDLRPQFVRSIKRMKRVAGFNRGGKRLTSPIRAVLPFTEKKK